LNESTSREYLNEGFGEKDAKDLVKVEMEAILRIRNKENREE